MDRKKECSIQGNMVKLQESFDGFQQVDKKDGFSRQIVEGQTGIKVDRVSDGSSQGDQGPTGGVKPEL